MSRNKLIVAVVATIVLLAGSIAAIVLISQNDSIENPAFAVEAFENARKVYMDPEQMEGDMEIYMTTIMDLGLLGSSKTKNSSTAQFKQIGTIDDFDMELIQNVVVEADGESQEVDVRLILLDGSVYLDAGTGDLEYFENMDEFSNNAFGSTIAENLETISNESFIAMVEDNTRYEYLTSESIEGFETYKYEIKFANEIYEDLIIEQMSGQGQDLGGFEFGIDDIKSYIWIDTKTNYVVKQDIDYGTIELKSEFGEIRIEDFFMTMTVNQFEDVVIEVPVDADLV